MIIGIPKKGKVTNVPTIKNKEWPFVIQKHKADRAGLHYDWRLGNPETGVGHSWVTRRIPGYGEKVLAKQTNDHTIPYFDFTGSIPEGYGKGNVETFRKGTAIITKGSPDKTTFTLNKGRQSERYTILRTNGDNHLLINHTPTAKSRKEIPNKKDRYKKVLLTQYTDPNIYASPKLDGAANVIVLKKFRHPEIFSYRSGKGPTQLIDHTFRLGLDKEIANVKTDKPTVLWAETLKLKSGKPIHVSELSGLLNSNVDKVRNKYKFENFVYNIDKYEGKDVSKFPFAKKLILLQTIVKNNPFLKLVPLSKTESEKKKLIDSIKTNKHKLTREGVIFFNTKTSIPSKVKFDTEHKVYIRGIQTGKGKFSESTGGITYSYKKDGPIIGIIGGGFTEAQRKDMYNNPDKYIGKKANIRAHEKLKSSSLRMPIFLNWVEDQWPNK